MILEGGNALQSWLHVLHCRGMDKAFNKNNDQEKEANQCGKEGDDKQRAACKIRDETGSFRC